MPACPTKPYPTVQPCCRDWRSRRSPKAERCAFLDLPGGPEAVLPKPFGVRVQRLFLLKFSYTQSFDTSGLASLSDFAPSSETPGASSDKPPLTAFQSRPSSRARSDAARMADIRV